jgi:hypothetical protein
LVVCLPFAKRSLTYEQSQKVAAVLTGRRRDKQTQKEEHASLLARDGPDSFLAIPQPALLRLQCERCRGHRSVSYYNKHFRDPIAFPRVGTCSRRRTNCAATQSTSRESTRGLPVIYELSANDALDRPEINTKWPW